MLRRLSERCLAAVAGAALRSVPWGREERAAVLMYHGVCRLPAWAADLYQHVLPHQFAEQMRLLRDNGWRVLSLERLVELAVAGRPLPPRSVALTFDDGYRSLLEAWPHIERAGFPATIFLATGYIGRASFGWLEGEWGNSEAAAPLSWAQVRELAGRGADFGSHTVSHRPLGPLPEAELHRELTDSRHDIEWRLERRVSLFSAPFAWPEEESFRVRLAELLRQAGYVGAVTTALGRVCRGAEVMALPRLPINAHDTLATFEAKLEGAYDWLRPVQRAYKRWLKPLRPAALRLARQTPQ